jgi:uncharacterized protein (TIGR02453 family)
VPAPGKQYRRAMRFTGFPPEAITFYEGLEADNSKGYWTANRGVYEEALKAPMTAMLTELEPEFGRFRTFRPNRDVRFSKDKSPYKTSIAAASETEGGAMHYVQLSAEGLLVGSGYFHMMNDQLVRFRAAVDDERRGSYMANLVAKLEKAGYKMIAIDELKTAPKGYAKDHPRVALLRRKGLALSRQWPVAAWLHTAAARKRSPMCSALPSR